MTPAQVSAWTTAISTAVQVGAGAVAVLRPLFTAYHPDEDAQYNAILASIVTDDERRIASTQAEIALLEAQHAITGNDPGDETK